MEKIHQFKEKLFDNSKVNKIKSYFNKFFSIDLYLILLFLVAIINWKYKLIWLIFTVDLLVILLIYFFNVSRIRLIPIAISIIISLRLNTSNDYILPIIIGSITVLFLLIYDLIRKKKNFNNGILVGMILIFISQIFSLVNTPVLVDSLRGLARWAFYIILFTYVLNIGFDDLNKDYSRYYISKIFIYLSLAVLIEIILYYLENGIGQNIINFYGGININFGWSMPKDVAMLYLATLPILSYYYTINQKKFYILLIIAFDVIMLHLMLSRGAYLAMIIMVLPLVLKTLSDVKHKTNFIITLIYSSIILLLGMLLIAIPTGIVKSFFDFISSKGPSIEERELMSSIGLNVFQRYPLFGGGINSSRFYLSIAIDSNYYENFIIQVLADTGIVGLITFAYYIVQIIKYVAIKNKYNSYILIIVIALIIQGLMETTFYNPLIMILFSFILPLLSTKDESMLILKGE